MDNQASNVAFYKSRTVLGRLSASFKFINDNLSTLLKLGTYCILPAAVLHALYFAVYGNSMGVGSQPLIYMAFVVVMAVVTLLCSVLYSSLFYTLLQKYAERGTLPAYRLKDLKNELITNAKKVFLLGIILFGLFAVYAGIFFLLMWASLYTLVVTVPLFLVLWLPFCYSGYIYILEDIPVWNALKKAFVMGMRTWGSTFVVLFLTGFLVCVIQTVVYLPWMVGLMAGNLASGAALLGGESALPVFFPYLMFVLGVIAILLSALAQMMVVLSLGFQYASVETSRKERVQLDQEV